MITPKAGWQIDPNNPNGVIRDPNAIIGIGGIPQTTPSQTFDYPAKPYITTYGGNYREGDVVPGQGTIMPDGTFSGISTPSPIVPITQTTPTTTGLTGLIPGETESESQRLQRVEAERLQGLATPESEAERRDRITRNFQGEIDALNAVYAIQRQEALQRGMGRLGTDAAIQNRRGLIGSSFGVAQTGETEQANAKDVAAVDAEKAAALSVIMGNIRKEIAQDAKDKEAAMQTSSAALIAFNKAKEDRTKLRLDNTIKNIVNHKSLITLPELEKWMDTPEFKALGIDPVQFKSEYKAALETKKTELETQVATQKKEQESAKKTAMDLLKTQTDITKPFSDGGYLWQYDTATGEFKKLGEAKSVASTTGTNTFGELTDADKSKGLNWLMAQPDVTQADIDAFKNDRQAQALIINAMNAQ